MVESIELLGLVECDDSDAVVFEVDKDGLVCHDECNLFDYLINQ